MRAAHFEQLFKKHAAKICSMFFYGPLEELQVNSVVAMDLAPGCEQLHEQTIPQIAVFADLRQHWPYSGPQAVVKRT